MMVTFLLDVEDILSPAADDIARDVASALSDESVAATFCVVGERVRQWRQRRREDVVEALARHDVGYHSNLHSVHPTTVELLEHADWPEGVEAVRRSETPGVEAIRETFGCAPSCWGGPGNTWGPQVNEAALSMGIEAVVYAQTRVPGGDVHRFAGLLMYPSGPAIGDHLLHHSRRWRRRLDRLCDEVRGSLSAGRQWCGVFLGHPSRVRHHGFWDDPGYARGANPTAGRVVLPRAKSDEQVRTALTNLRETVKRVREIPDVEVVTVREANERFRNAVEQPLSEAEAAEASRTIEANLAHMARWPILSRRFDVARIRAHTMSRLSTLARLNIDGRTDHTT